MTHDSSLGVFCWNSMLMASSNKLCKDDHLSTNQTYNKILKFTVCMHDEWGRAESWYSYDLTWSYKVNDNSTPPKK